MTTDGKLVRDKIPEIIEKQGLLPLTRTAEAAEYRRLLGAKLVEEVAEFLAAGTVDELADILEVVHAVAADLGVTLEELETARAVKHQRCGGFVTRTVWSGNS
jgi:predicted house-cleaning noncanonical NTP pyrophosphatase (MazG superfamily)